MLHPNPDTALLEDGELPPNIAVYMSDASVIRRLLPLLRIPESVTFAVPFRDSGLSARDYYNRLLTFPCVLRHPKDAPTHTAYISRGSDRGWYYRDAVGVKRGAQTRYKFSLGAVYASQHYKRAYLPKAPELAAWSARLLVDAGVAPPASVSLPALPERSKPSVARVYHGFKRLLEARWAFYEPDPVAFAEVFGSAWCGIGGERHFAEGRDRLLDLDLIRYAADYRYRIWAGVPK